MNAAFMSYENAAFMSYEEVSCRSNGSLLLACANSPGPVFARLQSGDDYYGCEWEGLWQHSGLRVRFWIESILATVAASLSTGSCTLVTIPVLPDHLGRGWLPGRRVAGPDRGGGEPRDGRCLDGDRSGRPAGR